MPMLINITPTEVEFLYNEKVYKITEIMKSGEKNLMIIGEEKLPEASVQVVTDDESIIPEK
jgi:hypothetical protein